MDGNLEKFIDESLKVGLQIMEKISKYLKKLDKQISSSSVYRGYSNEAYELVSEYGKKCTVIEMKTIGGTCVNIGCEPKKVVVCRKYRSTNKKCQRS